ncbi:hypothetical protein HBI76_033620 [Parastagonospora nodorum]|nr:hypothetical protein HBI76_033620 [Parastagonospora nodorum]
MDSYNDDDDHDDDRRGNRRKSHALSRRPNFLDDLFDQSIQQSMSAPLFKLVRKWISGQVGLDLTYLVWAIAIFASVSKYGKVAISWLSQNVTNSLELAENDAALTDLRIWIRRQPSHAMLSLLPSFEHLEWTDVSQKNGTKKIEGEKTHELLSSAGCTPFSYQGIPFVLCKPKGLWEVKSTLRCLWGNAKPIESLLKEVQKNAKSQTSNLSIFSNIAYSYRSEGGWLERRCRKRLIETVDLDPLVKQELVADLQDFFDEDTEGYYHQNGIPYRRGYLFYGPAGTGKTSLSTAIASHYDLSLYMINLANMNDSTLQEQVQKLPTRCVILFEDIDAAGVTRESTMVSRKGKSDSEDSEDDSERDGTRKKRATRKAKEPPPRKTQVTLSGLLNTLDGPGSKEGHVVILTTNAPDSLDGALIRPGRIDHTVFLGYSTKITAAITFIRIFGSDKRLAMPKKEVDRLGKRFGDVVPNNVLTPAEVQRFCMNRRGFPLTAITELPVYLKEMRSGKPRFEYDINRAAPQPVAGRDPAEDDHSSEETQETPPSSDESIVNSEKFNLSFEEQGFSSGLNQSTETTEHYSRPESLPKLSASSISITGPEDGLAYGEYYPRRYEASSANVNDKDIRQRILGFLDVLAPASPMPVVEDVRGHNFSVPEMVMPSLSMNAGHSVSAWTSQQAALQASDQNRLITTEILQPFHGNQCRQGLLNPSGLQSTQPSQQSPSHAEPEPARPLHVGRVTLELSHGEQPSPAVSAESSVYYTPLSLEEQIDASFHKIFQSSEEIYQEQSAARNERSTLILRTVDPQPLDELEHLHINDGGDKRD